MYLFKVFSTSHIIKKSLFFLVCVLLPHFAVSDEFQISGKQLPTLRLAICNWEPYYGETLPEGGAIVEVTREAFKRGGYNIDIRWLPWARALNLTKNNQFQGIIGAWYTEQRAEFFNFSEPLMSTEIVLFKRKGEKIHFSTLDDLKSYSLGVVLDTAPHEILKTQFNENLDTTVSTKANIRKLLAKRFDVMIDDKLNASFIMNSEFPQWRKSIEVVSPPLQVNEVHILIRKNLKGNEQIISAFNRGLQSMIKDGTYIQILDKHNFHPNAAGKQ